MELQKSLFGIDDQDGIEMTDGIGVDIVEICRFKKIKYNARPSFYKKLFKQNEIDYCLKFKNPYEHFAGKFALKESVKK